MKKTAIFLICVSLPLLFSCNFTSFRLSDSFIMNDLASEFSWKGFSEGKVLVAPVGNVQYANADIDPGRMEDFKFDMGERLLKKFNEDLDMQIEAVDLEGAWVNKSMLNDLSQSKDADYLFNPVLMEIFKKVIITRQYVCNGNSCSWQTVVIVLYRVALYVDIYNIKEGKVMASFEVNSLYQEGFLPLSIRMGINACVDYVIKKIKKEAKLEEKKRGN